MAEALILENQYLRVEFDPVTGLKLTDLLCGKSQYASKPFFMRYGDCYDYNIAEHCRMIADGDHSHITVMFDQFDFFARFKDNTYRKPDPGPDWVFTFTILLDNDHVVFCTEKIQGMDDEELKVVFPYGLGEFSSRDEVEVFLPCGYGSLLRFPRQDYVQLNCSIGYNYTSLPVYGIFQPDGGLGFYLKTPFDAVSTLTANNTDDHNAGISTFFVFEQNNANYARELHVYPLQLGQNYVHLAKLYRKVVKKEGRFISLNEKITRYPEVEKLVGAVIWKHNVYCAPRPEGVKHGYSMYMPRPDFNRYEGLPDNWTAKEIFDTAKAKGFDRVCVYNTGWNYMGFDSGYPRRLPPAQERGSVEDFSRAAEYARSLSPDYIFSVHDNYRDAYKNSPEFDADVLTCDKDGVPLSGGIWRGGRARLMCPSTYMRYAQRDLPQIAGMLGRGSIYIDVVGCSGMASCHHPAHPAGQREEAEARRELLQYAKEQMGSVATEGAPHDYCADIVDLGAFCGIYTLESNSLPDPPAVPIPFWQLVYHDSVLNYTAEGAYGAYGDEYMLYAALFGILPTQFDDESRLLSLGLRQTYREEMVFHEFLIPANVKKMADGSWCTNGVARTVYADGTGVVANFETEKFNYRGRILPPRSYAVIHDDAER